MSRRQHGLRRLLRVVSVRFAEGWGEVCQWCFLCESEHFKSYGVVTENV